MRQEITVKRKLPVNLASEDLPLFEQSLQVAFVRQHPIHLKNTWVLQDAVFSPGEMKFYSSHTHIANLGPLQFAKRLAYCAPKSWKKIPLGMWILDEWSANYFHWMTDCLPRLWEGLEREPGCPVILPESFRSLPYVTQSLELIGAKVLFFKASQNLHVERLILTARTATFPNFLPELAQKTRNKLSLTPAKKPGERSTSAESLPQSAKPTTTLRLKSCFRKRGLRSYTPKSLALPSRFSSCRKPSFWFVSTAQH